MKIRILIIAAVLMAVSVVSSRAITQPVNITVSNGVAAVYDNSLGNFGDASVFAWMQADITAYNNLKGTGYPGPTESSSGTPFVNVDNGFGGASVTITLNGLYDYIFLHWGGQGGGSEQLYFVGGLAGDFLFQQPPNGPPLVGGLSFYSLYGPNTQVPDGGETMVLLGSVLTAFGLIRRKF